MNYTVTYHLTEPWITILGSLAIVATIALLVFLFLVLRRLL